MSDVEKQIEQWRHHLDGSEWLGQADVQELENHLRDQMQHLQTAGLSEEEAFFVGRHRLGDRAALEEEFAKVHPQRRVAHRLYWMILGLLTWFVAWPLGHHLSTVSGYLAYISGLRGVLLTVFTLLAALAVYSLVGFLLLRYLASHAHACFLARRIAVPLAVGALAAGANLFLCWTVNFADHHLWRRLLPTTEVWRQITQPGGLHAWYLMMFLLAMALAVFARQSGTRAEAL